MPLGAHMSTAGGVEKALTRGQSIGCETIQLFVTSPSRWQTRTLTEENIDQFARNRAESGITPVAAHARYLINLGSPDDELWPKSIQACHEELELCHKLELPYFILHPGSHMEAGEDAGLARVASALDMIRQETPFEGKLLLETTAGQGTCLGHRFEQIGRLMELVQEDVWLGVCFDTCHAFAAGYELRTRAGADKTWAEFKTHIGLDRLAFVHLNDTKGDLGSHLDRHEHIGKGGLGTEAFRLLLNDHRLKELPMVLETPKGPKMEEDVVNLERLRSLIEEDTV